MIKDRGIRISVDERGKITSGKRRDDKEDGLPQSLEYFNISKFPELIECYGEKPDKLIIFFPTNNIKDFFDDSYRLWGRNNQLIRECDSESCYHRIAEEIDFKKGEKRKFEQGQNTPCICKYMPETVINSKKKEVRNPKLCSYVMYLKAYVADIKRGEVNNPNCILFQTRSKNSGDNIYNDIEKLWTLNNGNLWGVAFKIMVKMVPGKDKPEVKFPIWSVTPVQKSLSNIREKTERMLSVGKALGLPEGQSNDNFDTTESPREDANDFESPDFFINKFKELNSKKEIDEFYKKHKVDFSFFDLNIQDDIEKAYKTRLSEVKI